MSTIEIFTASEESDPDPEPQPLLETIDPPYFDSYHEDVPRNSLIDRVVIIEKQSEHYRIFMLGEAAGENAGEVHIDINGIYAGQLNEAGRELFLNRLKQARRISDFLGN